MKISKDVLPAIIDRIQKQGSSLGAEAKALGMSYRTTLITALREFMGREAYDAMIEGKRPRTSSGVSIVSAIEDKDVPIIFGTPTKDGWAMRYPLLSPTATFISPTGEQYVRATDNAKADLIVDGKAKGLGLIRLRKARGSERVGERPSPVEHVPLVKGGVALVVKEPTPKATKQKKPLKKDAKKTKRGN